MRIVYWPSFALAKAEIIARLQAIEGVDLVVAEYPDVLEALAGADGLVTADSPVEHARRAVEVLERPENTVRWMHFISAGQEGYLAAGMPKNVAVTVPTGGVSPTVAEHAMALLLALARRVPDAIAVTAERDWDRRRMARMRSLEEARLVLVGYGSIGREVARRARAFGMRVTAVNRTVAAEPDVDEMVPLERLHEALSTADAVVVAIALTAATEKLIGRAALAACKPGALLVNVSRGGTIDQAALVEALGTGQIGGAGLDVTDPEPLPADDPLWSAPNLIVTPHIAGGASAVSLRRLAEGAGANLERLMAGETLLNRIA